MKATNRNDGFSLIELLIAVFLIGVLTALVIPAVRRLRENSMTVQCLSNLKNLYGGIVAYGADHQGRFPVSVTTATTSVWYVPLRDYIPGVSGERAAPYFCPANPADPTAGSGKHTNYAINGFLYEEVSPPSGKRPSLRISQLAGARALLLDSYEKGGSPLETWYAQSGNRGGWVFAEPLHGNRVNVIFTDGHVESPAVEPRIITQGNLGELKTRWFWPVLE